jgi:hypothetical protein
MESDREDFDVESATADELREFLSRHRGRGRTHGEKL